MQFQEPQLRRLRASGSSSREPIVTGTIWTHPHVRRRLREVEVLMTSWGCPPLTAERLCRRARSCEAIFHCAGTVRDFVTDEVWRRGILVTNAADENAIPVAEFTLAAIIFAGKKAPFLAQDARRHRRGLVSYAAARGELSNRGRTIGVVGFLPDGTPGHRTAARAWRSTSWSRTPTRTRPR